ncbi:MAG: CueP family metal-binding protein [Spirochaetia bacterium]|jgi:hypothetical protein|nr:CueP family metal-binding protein [Spirochaetia bacterium]
MKKIAIIALSLISIIIFFACSSREVQSQPMSSSSSKSSISPKGLDNLDAREALVLANKWKTSNPEITSFIESDKLIVQFANKTTVEIPLPSESMVVALAPYIDKTHSCSTHYISGCQGELVDVSVKVLALQDDGTVLIDQTMKTMANGFIELWLPRNKNISLTLESMNLKSEGELTTFSDSNTCITTFQLL